MDSTTARILKSFIMTQTQMVRDFMTIQLRQNELPELIKESNRRARTCDPLRSAGYGDLDQMREHDARTSALREEFTDNQRRLTEIRDWIPELTSA